MQVLYNCRTTRVAIMLLLLMAAMAADVQFTGTWTGKTNDLPAVELALQQDKGEVRGTISFYFQSRGEDGKWRLGNKTTLPILSPALNGNELTFESIHHKKHGSPELGCKYSGKGQIPVRV